MRQGRTAGCQGWVRQRPQAALDKYLATDYFLSEIRADWGRAFEVRKPLPDGTVYHVHLDAELGDSCDCKGHIRWGRCKHASAVKALIAQGRL
jgi:hypothetical protein